MAFTQGTKLGPYEVLSPIGAGGMGEVYKARDSRLNRIIAVKVLSPKLSADADARARFEREARLIAGLNHPHICTLHDVGQHDGAGYLVMEYLEGQNLAERLKNGPLPLDEALKVASEIADALDKAHAQGVFHRDLKPGNIMLTKGGAKLLDFGLAKLMERSVQDPSISSSPTVADISGTGTVAGTIQYMAPEQLEGAAPDARADIFSFGAVLYEMLTGRKAFEGTSQAGVIAAILKSEPVPVSSLRPSTPQALDQLIRGCMSKGREDRWQTIHDVAKQLQWIASSAQPASPATTTAPRRRWPSMAAAVVATVMAVVAIAAVLQYLRLPAVTPDAVRLTVAFPDRIIFSVGEYAFRAASISPDGRRIVFTGVDHATGKSSLYVRPIDSADATLLEGTGEGIDPFWSSDSKSIGFFAENKLKRLDLSGGTPQIIADDASTGGGTWNSDGVILVSLKNPGPVYRVSSTGGQATPATDFDPGKEVDHDWPQFTSDGNHFLYMAWGRTTSENTIYVGSLNSKERKLLLKGVNAFAYAHPDHVAFLRGGTVMVQKFDTGRAELLGNPVQVAENALPPMAASHNGVITYRTVKPEPRPMLWLKPDGAEIGPALPPGYYIDPVVSPDGSRLAFAKQESAGDGLDIWILEVATGRQRRLTVDAADDRAPVWSPDSQEIIFLSFRQSGPGLYRKNSNGVGAEELIVPATQLIWPYQWPDKNTLLYFAGATGAFDVLALPLDTLKPAPLIHTPFNEVDGAVSPDGRWLAYASSETGRFEVYVTTYPPSGTKLPVTTAGGADPVWSKDGRELYYVNSSTTEFLSVSVKPGNPPEFGSPRRLYPGPLDYATAHSFDVGNGRILVAPSYARLGDINVLLNWPSLLKK